MWWWFLLQRRTHGKKERAKDGNGTCLSLTGNHFVLGERAEHIIDYLSQVLSVAIISSFLSLSCILVPVPCWWVVQDLQHEECVGWKLLRVHSVQPAQPTVAAAWIKPQKTNFRSSWYQTSPTKVQQVQPWRRNEWNAQHLPPSVVSITASHPVAIFIKKKLGRMAMRKENVWNSLETVCRHAISVKLGRNSASLPNSRCS